MLYRWTVRVWHLAEVWCVTRRGTDLNDQSEGSHAQDPLGLTASPSGVETSSFSCLCSQVLLPARRWRDKVGQSSHLSGAQPAVPSPARLCRQGELKCQFCYWRDPSQWGIVAEPLPRFISQFLHLYFNRSFKLKRHKLFVK